MSKRWTSHTEKATLLVVALLLSLIDGFAVSHFSAIAACAGFVGGMAMFLVNGAHNTNDFGRAVFVAVNAMVYFYVLKQLARIWRARA